MSNRLSVALYCSVLLLTGCSGKKEQSGDVPAGLKRITLHVKDMAERLDLTWLAWPNKVQEALSGLPGVKSIKVDEVDLKKNLLRIDYDPEKVTPGAMLEVVGKQGFEGTIVP